MVQNSSTSSRPVSSESSSSNHSNQSCFSPNSSLNYFNWHEKRQKLFIYWCFTHFVHGMIHSIRYSSQYLYFRDIMQVSNPDFFYGLSVSFMGMTGVVFPLIISPFIDRTRDIKKAIIIVNVLGMLGNLLYALPFHPVIPLFGQLLAGTTPAFGVIAMGEISRCYTPEKLTKRVSALSLIYSVGTFTSIGLVFCFLYVDFYIGKWHINFADMPGIFLTFAFSVSLVLSFFLVSDVSKEFDLKLEERIKRSSGCPSPKSNLSGKSTPSFSRRCSLSPDENKLSFEDLNSEGNRLSGEFESRSLVTETQKSREAYYFDEIGNCKNENTEKKEKKYQKTFETAKSNLFSFPSFNRNGYAKLREAFKRNNSDDSSDDGNGEKSCGTFKTTLHFIWKILCFKDTLILMFVTFMEAFVYSIVVTSLPVIASNFLNWGKVELAILSMVNKFLSVIISGSIYFLTDYLHDFLLLVYGTFLSCLALLTLAVLTLLKDDSTAVTVLLFAIAALSISGVPLVITSTRSMLAKLVPTEIQSLSEAVRMSVFEASFVPAGFLVPLITLNLTGTAITLLILMVSLSFVTIRQMKSLVELKEADEYWHADDAKLNGCTQ